jgi:hypothetical protein
MTTKNTKPPPYLKTYLGDPLGMLVERLSLSPVHCAAIALGTALIVDAISYALVRGEVIELSGWTDVWAYVAYLYLVFPVIVGAYVWISRAASRLFRELRDSEALAVSEEEYDRFVLGALQARYNHRGWTIASCIVVILVAAYYAYSYTIGWPWLPRLLRIVKVVVPYMPGWYIVCQIVARQAVTIWGLRRVFRHFQVTPHPLHPDRCGGLRAINNYAVGSTYVIAAAGIGVGLMVYSTLHREGALSPDMALLTAVYVVAALLCFFMPPLTAHRAMDQAKRKLLAEISRQFQQDYAQATARLGDGTGELQAHVEKVQNLRALYEMTDAFPVWPFDTATLRRFVVAVTIPLVPAIVELAIAVANAVLSAS